MSEPMVSLKNKQTTSQDQNNMILEEELMKSDFSFHRRQILNRFGVDYRQTSC